MRPNNGAAQAIRRRELTSRRPAEATFRAPTPESDSVLMIPEPDRQFRHHLAYLGFCYALVDDVPRSERIRSMVRRLDRRRRFRLQSLN